MGVQVSLEGEVKTDGTLELTTKVPMPAGRVLVTVQPLNPLAPEDPFWQMLERIWAGQKARGHRPRATELIDAEIEAFRQETEEEMGAVEELHEKCHPTQRPDEG